MRSKTLWIKPEYLQQILDGHKTTEVRVAYSNINRLLVGDRLLLNDQHPYIIERIGRYANFEDLLAREDKRAIAPDVPPEQLLEHIRAIYSPEKEALGAVALQIKPAPQLRVHITYDYEEEVVAYLREQLLPGIAVTKGEVNLSIVHYHVLVDGRPTQELLTASPDLHTVIIPWVGVSPETRNLLKEFPELALHNLHHNAKPVAELAIALMLGASKAIIPYDQQLRADDWRMRYERPGPSLLLSGKTALILGYGAIGQRIAAGCKGLGMHVLAIKRTVQHDKDANADEICAMKMLSELLPRADVLVNTLPLTEETDGLLGNEELTRLPEGCVLVNVGRGATIDQEALFTALRDGRLHSAGLDVWYNYPEDKDARARTAPADFPFHELENVVMSPHRGGDTRETNRLRMEHLSVMLNHMLEGKQVPNRVDLQRGY